MPLVQRGAADYARLWLSPPPTQWVLIWQLLPWTQSPAHPIKPRNIGGSVELRDRDAHIDKRAHTHFCSANVKDASSTHLCSLVWGLDFLFNGLHHHGVSCSAALLRSSRVFLSFAFTTSYPELPLVGCGVVESSLLLTTDLTQGLITLMFTEQAENRTMSIFTFLWSDRALSVFSPCPLIMMTWLRLISSNEEY